MAFIPLVLIYIAIGIAIGALVGFLTQLVSKQLQRIKMRLF